MRALLVTLAVAAALVAFAACGGSSEADGARGVVQRFGTATAKHDYQTICDLLLSQRLVQGVEQYGLPCELAFKRGLDSVRRPRLVIRSVKVAGKVALVRVRSTAANQTASIDTMRLIRESGGWRIAALGTGQTAIPTGPPPQAERGGARTAPAPASTLPAGDD